MPTFTLFDSLLLLGGAQGLFLALLLQRRKVANKPAANYLIVLVLLVSFLLFAKLSYRSEWLYSYAEVILLPDVVLFVLGPCLWLFTRHLLRLPPLSTGRLLLHALPACLHIAVVNTILGQHLNGHWHFLNNHTIYLSFLFIEGSAILSIIGYLILSFRLSERAFSASEPAANTQIARGFLSAFFRVGIVLSTCWIISFAYRLFVFDPAYLMYQVFWFLTVAYVFWLAYKVVLQTELFNLPASLTTNRVLTTDDQLVLKGVMQHLENEKPYLESQLKLADLAQALDLPAHELSRIINTGTGQSFFDLINTWRIRAFIEAYEAATEQERSILQLAYQSGFNSKSAFNRAFQKSKGVSPSEYFKNILV